MRTPFGSDYLVKIPSSSIYPTVDQHEQGGGRFGRDHSTFSIWATAEICLVSFNRTLSLRTQLKQTVSLVTLAVQNAVLSLVMHYSRVSIPPSEAYSAGTAVLLVELLKGTISFTIAYMRIETATTYCMPPTVPMPRSSPLVRLRKLGKEIFRSDCLKLSIPAILYGASSFFSRVESEDIEADGALFRYQSSKTTCSTLPQRTSTLQRSKSHTKSKSSPPQDSPSFFYTKRSA